MVRDAVERWRRKAHAYFPERQLYVRSEGGFRAIVVSSDRQLAFAAAVLAIALWLTFSTGAVLLQLAGGGHGDQEAVRLRARYERLIADRDARLNSALAQLNENGQSIEALAQSTERRHEALAMMLTGAKGDAGLASAVTPASAAAFTGRSPADGVAAVRADQDRLIAQTEAYAKSDSLGGPLIEAKDPRALAAVLDVDEDFAERIQRAASDLAETRDLTAASTSLPLAAPTTGTTRASGFGVREDPFTGRPAFHPGLDFAGPMMTAIHATAPGIVSFTGVRNGYGNTVEIDHGHGLKTRYGHLAAILVNVGDHVALGQRIAAMGSTGRSTGPHLHYEVWVDGRPQNPQRFLEAGDNVHQATE
jgi:murein DD-endopeptidase MepM/ murein hydrolase activator NlpD